MTTTTTTTSSDRTATLVPVLTVADGSGNGPPARPRLWYLLPSLAAIDLTLTLSLVLAILFDDAHRPSSNPADDNDSPNLALAILACTLARACVVGLAGFSTKPLSGFGVVFAVVCLASLLFVISIASLLFQAQPQRQPSPSPTAGAIAAHNPLLPLPLLLTSSSLFPILEWLLFLFLVRQTSQSQDACGLENDEDDRPTGHYGTFDG